MAVYVDTGAWIALHERNDRHHAHAIATLERLAAENELLVCGWHTLAEFADGLAQRYGQKRAASEVAKILASPRVRVEGSEPHREAALDLFGSRSSWNVDLSDCLSFVFMKARRLERAFTYDRDFEKAGFRIEP